MLQLNAAVWKSRPGRCRLPGGVKIRNSNRCNAIHDATDRSIKYLHYAFFAACIVLFSFRVHFEKQKNCVQPFSLRSCRRFPCLHSSGRSETILVKNLKEKRLIFNEFSITHYAACMQRRRRRYMRIKLFSLPANTLFRYFLSLVFIWRWNLFLDICCCFLAFIFRWASVSGDCMIYQAHFKIENWMHFTVNAHSTFK